MINEDKAKALDLSLKTSKKVGLEFADQKPDYEDPTRNIEDSLLSKIKSDPKPVNKEINGPKGLEPTRYGDWESKGRCHDF